MSARSFSEAFRQHLAEKSGAPLLPERLHVETWDHIEPIVIPSPVGVTDQRGIFSLGSRVAAWSPWDFARVLEREVKIDREIAQRQAQYDQLRRENGLEPKPLPKVTK